MKRLLFLIISLVPFLSLAQSGSISIISTNSSYIEGKKGNTFVINVDVGKPSQVNNLVGISFHLNWDTPSAIKLETKSTGSFWGNNPMVISQDYSSYIEMGIASSTGGHSGSGSVAEIQFSIVSDVAQLIQVQFTITHLTAIDKDGNSVELSPTNSPFTLNLCKDIPLSLTSANGNEYWKEGTSKNITWHSDITGNVKLEYSTTNGNTWMTIIGSTPASNKSYNWTVPATPSEECLIRITSLSDSQLFDVSEKVFTIYPFNQTEGLGPYFTDENTVLLMHFNGNYNNTANQSLDGIGNNSVSFDSSLREDLDSCVYIDNSSDRAFSNVEIPFYNELSLTSDWTIEFWFKIKSWGSGTTSYPFMFIKTGANYFFSPLPGIKSMQVGYDYEGGAEVLVLPENSVESNRWYHISFIRNTTNTTLKCLLHDSEMKLLQSVSSVYNPLHVPKTNQDPVRLGGFSGGSNCQFDGYADELRISNIVREYKSIAVITPNGGERLTIGAKATIQWTSNDIEKVTLEYSTNEGATWTSIASNINAAAGSFLWTVPNSVSSGCKIRVSDQVDPSCNDSSDQFFSIIKPVNLVLTYPNGGESWIVGNQQTITWNSEGVSNVKLEYSTDLGVTWATIVNSIAASQHTYSFTVPNEIAYEWKIRITDVSEPTRSDVSDGLFITYDELPEAVSPLLEIEYPVFVWPLNAYYPSTTAADDQVINGKVGNACGPTVVANLIRYWEFPLKGSGSRTFTDHLNCTWSANFGETYYNYDQMPRYVAPNATQEEYDAVATMMYHAGVAMHNTYRTGARDGVIEAFHEFFNYNRKSKFLYRNDYTPEQWDKIFKSEFAQKRPIVIGGDGGVLPDGSVGGHWFICDGYNSANKFHIRWDYGENSNEYLPLYEFKPFHVNNWALVYLEPDRHGEELTLTSPAGFESWQQGSQQTVRWNSSGITSLKIEYSINNGANYVTLATNVPASTGSYVVTLPVGTSKDCKIRVSDANDINVYSRNKAPFSVFDQKELTITPCFPENLQPGSVFPIRWNSKGITTVSIDYSIDNGSTWIAIADTIASLEVYDWLVPYVSSKTCKVRLTDKSDIDYKSISQLFAISSAQYVGGPYAVDANTVALLHFNGNYRNEAVNSKDGIANQIVSFTENYPLGTDQGIYVENPNDAVYSNVEIPYYSALTLTKDWTIELWFMINNWGTGTVSYPTLVTKTGRNYYIDPDPVSKTIRAGYDISTGGEMVVLPNNSVQTNKWYHVTFIRNTTNKTLQLLLHDENRKLVSSATVNYTSSNMPRTSSEALMVGGYHVIGNSQFDGCIDELRISKVVREYSDPGNLEELTVKFSVDLNYQIKNGIFNPATDEVFLKGSFNGWSDQNPMSLESDGIYTSTLVLEPSASYQYKYFINSAGAENGGWEMNIADGENGNRVLKTGTTSMVLPKDYFNNRGVSAEELREGFMVKNYPNPFSGSTDFLFTVSSATHVSITVFDMLGKEVDNVVNENLQPGSYVREWDAPGLKGGIYFYRMKAGGFSTTRRLVVIR